MTSKQTSWPPHLSWARGLCDTLEEAAFLDAFADATASDSPPPPPAAKEKDEHR